MNVKVIVSAKKAIIGVLVHVFVRIVSISMTMVRFREKGIAKEKCYTAKIAIIMWDVNVDNIVISKLVKTKTSSKHLIEIKFDKAGRPLVLITLKKETVY